MIIIDHKIPQKAKQKLKQIDELLELKTSGIVYEAISGHPDIFLSFIDKQCVVSTNLPDQFVKPLRDSNIEFVIGEEGVGEKYPASSKYNVVCDDDFLIHNFRNTDSKILQLGEDMDLIHVDQGYTRCNLIPLGNKHYITSDKGIERTLKRFDLEVIYVDPSEIILPGFSHGFIGGCAGIHENKIYFIGKLTHLKEEDALKTFIISQKLEIVELYDGPLFDGGSIFFV